LRSNPTIGLTLDKAVVTGPGTLELNTTIMIKGTEQRLGLPATVTVLDGGAVRIVTKAELNRQEFGVDGKHDGHDGRHHDRRSDRGVRQAVVASPLCPTRP